MIVVSRFTDTYLKLDITKYCAFFVDTIKKVPSTSRRYNPVDHSWSVEQSYLAPLVKAIGPYNFASEDPVIEAIINPPEKIAEEKNAAKNRLKDVKLIRNMDFKTAPMPHQIEGFNWAIAKPKLLIADMPGLGKTKTAIDAAVWRKSRNLINKCLIVCCVNSTKYNWQKEIGIHSSEGCVVFDQATPAKKEAAIEAWATSDDLFGIINIESIRPKDVQKSDIYRMLRGQTEARNMPYNPILKKLNKIADMVVVDEIHKCKNATSKQGVALQQLTPAFRLGLSGTPMTNKIDDLWNILKWVGGYHDSYWTFRETFCIMGGFNEKEIAGYRNMDRLHNILNSCMLRRRKDEVLDLPPKIFQTEYIELSKAEKSRYEEAKEGIIQKITNGTGNIQAVYSQNALTTILKLREVTDGLDIDTGLPVDEDANSKLVRIKELLEEEILPYGKKAIIYSSWETIARMYRDHLKDYEPAYIVGAVSPEDRQKEVDRFQSDPKCKLAIGTIGAMGTGLTLTAASYVIFVDKNWNDTENEQAEDRAYRIGTDDNVVIISVVAKDTIDERVEDALKEKRAIFSTVIDKAAAKTTRRKDDIAFLLGM